ncbi:TRAP transporter small permease [Salinispirillum marinum]|uniref:TRAP transporter small permease protein n=2 Tax=Saccharospirillaceae TaxID=255527 RepID=A0ABV8BEC2_9GAMM
MMSFIHRIADIVRTAAFVLSQIGGVILILSMLAVLFDVITRTVFGMTDGAVDFTFRGSYEIVRYGLLLSMAYALPYALKDGQVIVDLFTDKMSDANKNRMAAFYVFFFGVFGFILSRGLLSSIEHVQMTGETSQDFGISMAYYYGATLIGTLMLGVRGITVAWEYLTAQTYQESGDHL